MMGEPSCSFPMTDYDMLEAAIRDFQGEDVLGHLIDHVDMNLYAHGRTLLHHAVAHDNVPAAALLLSRGANVDSEDMRNETPLHQVRSCAAASLLLRRGACAKRRRTDGATPLHTCPSRAVARLLLQHGGDVHSRTAGGDTPLHLCKDARVVAWLVDEGGADANAVNANKFTPLHIACSFGRWAVVSALLARHAALDSRDCSGRTPMDVAKAVRGVFAQLGAAKKDVDAAHESRELERTMMTLDAWRRGREMGRPTDEIRRQMTWQALETVCRDPTTAIQAATGLPSDLVDNIIVDWLGPWAVTIE
ncbi:Aste57867_11337 [Aphanomyces stellatus]|uniref:Aste57867_11337 protein n=1 Tax=Aphanomyces stellatus TaxID=120398 RepID=A0A485KTB7_9STRA|nr:hypothetical protein As57867_011295 [Aphanomyces stellatus]VFT88199.1 Aste57867_11337 [Aphanomyces stellatus]